MFLFFHFLHSNVPENKSHKKKWGMLFLTCIKLVARVLTCACTIAGIKWIRLVMIIVTSGFSKKSFLLFSDAAICRYSSKRVLLEILQYSQENSCVGVSLFQPHLKRDFNKEDSCEKCQILQKALFVEHLQWLLFQFDKVTVQWWASANLLFLNKNKICGMVSTKNVCRSSQSMLFTHH